MIFDVVGDGIMHLTVRAGAPLALRYRRCLADGTVRELLGEVYAFTIWTRDGRVESVASTIQRDLDGDYAEMVHPVGLSTELGGMVGLRWALDEVLTNDERDPRWAGNLYILGSPATIAGTAPPLAAGDSNWIIEKDPD